MGLFYVRGLGVWVTYIIKVTTFTKNITRKLKNFLFFKISF